MSVRNHSATVGFRRVLLVPLLAWFVIGGTSCSSQGGADSHDMGMAEPGGAPDLAARSPILVTVEVEGQGHVTSNPAGIDCPGRCSAQFMAGVRLELTAAADLRQNFIEWSGVCAGANPICLPTPEGDVTIGAHFAARHCSADNWCIEEPLPMGIGALNKVWGSSDHDVWAVGVDGTMVRFNGTRWYAVDGGTLQNLVGLWGSATNDVWTVGGGQTLLHWDGVTWTSTQPPALPGLFSLWGSSATDVWTYGASPFSESFFLRWDGTAWKRATIGIKATLLGLWGSGRSDLWAVGSQGTIYHWNGVDWTSVAGDAMASDLNDVWGSSSKDVWAVGNSGSLMHFDGATWTPATSGTTQNLRGVWGTAPDAVWTVGDSGTLLRYDGHAWTALDSGVTQALRGIWGVDSKTIFAVGDGGILRYLP